MSIDLHLDQKIKRQKLENIEHCLQLLDELHPSKQTNPVYAEYFEKVVAFLESEKERIESGVW